MSPFSVTDHVYMTQALRLAEQGLYTTQPNPRVGCVVVRDVVIVGIGAHHKAGEAHAEIIALQAAGQRARGASLYVNLEPCAHFGRTPALCRCHYCRGGEAGGGSYAGCQPFGGGCRDCSFACS